MIRNVIVTVLISGGVALTVTGCGAGAEAKQHVARRTPHSSPTSTQDAALAAYRGMWTAYASATNAGTATSTELSTYAAGDALRDLVKLLRNEQQKHIVTRGRPVLNPSVASMSYKGRPGVIRIVDCTSDRGWLRYHTNGEPVDDKPGGRHHAEALVQRSDGAWKVNQFFVEGPGTC